MKIITSILVHNFLFALFVSASAGAAPVRWELQNAVGSDGVVITGSYIYDADTAEYSDVAVTSAPGGAACDGQYNAGFNSGSALDKSILRGDVSGCALQLLFNGFELTDSGGVVPLNLLGPGIGSRESEIPGGDFRWLVSGELVGTPVVLDEDDDGVFDEVDECPLTPSGATVGSAGCSIEQWCPATELHFRPYVHCVVTRSRELVSEGVLARREGRWLRWRAPFTWIRARRSE